MRRSLGALTTAGILAVITLPAIGEDTKTDEQSAKAQAVPDKEFREHFAKQPRYLFGCGIIWANWLGADWSFDGASMTKIKAMGGTNVPINIPWVDVEGKPGEWTFEYVDHQVAQAEKRKLAMFAYMGLTPPWALPAETVAKYGSGCGYRFPPPDEYTEQFITYCKKVAKRYKGRIQHYQFWNEPNGCSWINDGCGNGHEADNTRKLYTKWLKIWYTAMKSEDPDCILGAGALDYHDGVSNGYTYLEGMYQHGAKGYFDAFNIHPYDKGATLHHKAIEDTRRVMVENGDGLKGIWISEYGWAMKDEEEKARRVTQSLQELTDPKYYYVTMANYLSIIDPAGEPGYGLCDNNLKPRKAYLAFQKFVKEYQRRTGKTRPQE